MNNHFRHLIIIPLFWICAFTHAKVNEPLLKKLDTAINMKEVYSEMKENKIKNLKFLLENTHSYSEKARIARNLYGEYTDFAKDSAMVYIQKMSDFAMLSKDQSLINLSLFNTARVLSGVGHFEEASKIIIGARRDEFSNEEMIEYYLSQIILHEQWEKFSTDEGNRRIHRDMAQSYRDSLILLNDVPIHLQAFTNAGYYLTANDYPGAISYLSEAIESFEEWSHNKGVVAFCLAEAYQKNGNLEKAIQNYSLSCIIDVINGVKESSSMIRLSKLLFEEGELDRAYKYVQCALEDAIACNARINTLEMSEMFLLIQKTYQEKETKRVRFIIVLLIIMAALIVALTVSAYLVFTQKERIKQYNAELQESATIKDMYVGLYMEQVAKQSQKVESIRKRGLRLSKQLKSEPMEDFFITHFKNNDDLHTFYREFDETILALFPDFVEEFHKLLKDGNAFRPKNENSLSPELRIYALIRLGLTDNNKIAQFLQYSLSTIYNYKTKVHNLALDSRDDFEAKVMRICK